ncbi:hypothetical protein NPS53_09290 [Pseudomonas putida]|uniref:hypothetical protein n=1 Tax=Pseudomonas putida TaxID=303 RepID=UPI00236394D1|nr:hypothetical protein [Pseudomonas putida]MDD2139770.1 hypothetical protein [Pseudomonas putida]HDS1721694.1 hypothetical protein [Pseudomonas putida]
MAGKNGSRYILGHLSYAELATVKDGQQAVVVLNPGEPKARFEVSKNIKGAFSRLGRSCVVNTQMILIESEPGNFKQGQILTITPNGGGPVSPGEDQLAPDHPEQSDSADATLKDCLGTATHLRDQLHRLFTDAPPLLGELVGPELERVAALCRSLERWNSLSDPD